MKYGLIGEKLGHSYSPYIHAAFADYSYVLQALPPAELERFIRAKQFNGINVTIPYKEAVMPMLDEISDKAQVIGCVNTVINRDGKLFGYNTDYYGFSYLARKADISFKGKHVIILGSGGTCKTAKAVCMDSGAASVTVVSRSGEVNYSNAARLTDTQIIINASPVGMFPDNDGLPLDLSAFKKAEGVIDVIYNPLKTRLVLAAEKLGIKAVGGLDMLVAQGASASALFTGRTVTDAEVDAAAALIRAHYINAVLIGMPGSGKSAVGRRLAKATGRKFYDADVETEKRLGRTIPEIFAEKGEEYFRRQETQTLRILSAKSGVIIATGGGAVKRAENIEMLKQNGKLFFITRSLEKLAVKGRPLSADGSVGKLYEERLPLYIAAADKVVDNDGKFNETVQSIKGELQ